MTTTNTLQSFFAARSQRVLAQASALVLVAALGTLAPTSSAQAAIVYSGAVNLLIPVTTAGLYLNVVTGASSTAPALAPGWDINPFSTSQLSFFNPTAPTGGVYVVGLGSSAARPDNLAFGTLIDASQGYGSGAGEITGATAFLLNSDDNYLGFRFQNEAAGNQVQFGWARIHLGDTLTSSDRAILGYAYDDSAAGIRAGDTGAVVVNGVPEPTSLALAMLALTAMGAGAVRRRAHPAA